MGVDPEICICGARMIVDDAITDGEKIAEILANLNSFLSKHRGMPNIFMVNFSGIGNLMNTAIRH